MFRLSFIKMLICSVMLFSISGCGLLRKHTLTIRSIKLLTPSTVKTCDADAAPFGGGDGSVSDPYMICTALQLEQISVGANASKHYILTNDIDFAPYLVTIQNWTGSPIDYNTNIMSMFAQIPNFSGSFDGQDYTLKNFKAKEGTWINVLSGTVKNLKIDAFTIERKAADNIGTVANTINAGTATHITVTNSDVKSRDNAFLGSHFGNAINATLSDLHSADVNVFSPAQSTGDAFVGGIVGSMDTSTLTDCSVSGTSNVAGYHPTFPALIGRYAGGVVGLAVNSNITNCSSNAAVYGDGGLGGIVGYFMSSSANQIVNSHATGNITYEGTGFNGGLGGIVVGATVSQCSATGTVNFNTAGEADIGGLIGWSEDTDISSSATSGIVYGAEHMGGIAGRFISTGAPHSISNCTSTSDLHYDTTVGSVGGIVGFIHQTDIGDSHYLGQITPTGSPADNLGGIAGRMEDASITNSYSAGYIEGGSYIGGLAGTFKNSVISLSYSKIDIVGGGAGSGVGGIVGNIEGGTAMTPAHANISDVFYIHEDIVGADRVGGLIGGIAPFTNGNLDRGYCFANTITGTNGSSNFELVGENASAGMSFSGLFYKDTLGFNDPLGDAKTASDLTGATGLAYLSGIPFNFGSGAWKSQLIDLPYFDWMTAAP